MSRYLSEQAKILAVGEALSGMYTLTSIAQKYGLSIGYLSMLASRARNAVGGRETQKKRKSKKRHRANQQIVDLTNRLLTLEEKINAIFK